MCAYHDDHPLTIAILAHTLLRPNSNNFLRELNFYGASFSSVSIQTLINALTKTDQITELAFFYCYIPQDQPTLNSLSSYIQSTSTLTFFSMEANKFNKSNDPLLIHRIYYIWHLNPSPLEKSSYP